MAIYDPFVQNQLNLALLRQLGNGADITNIYPGMPGTGGGSRTPVIGPSMGFDSGFSTDNVYEPLGPTYVNGQMEGFVRTGMGTSQMPLTPDPLPLPPINTGLTPQGFVRTGPSSSPVPTFVNGQMEGFVRTGNNYAATSEGYWESRPDGSTVFVRYTTKPDNVNTTTNTNVTTDPTLGPKGGGNTGNGGTTNGPTDTPMPTPPQPLPPSNSRIYTRIDINNDIVEQTRQIVTRGLWGSTSCNSLPVGSMSTFYTSSHQTTTQKQYYYDVMISSSAAKCDVEFSITYGHYQGSGSYSGGGQLNDSPSRAIYSQYMLLTDEIQQNTRFKLTDGTYLDDIYVINISKSRLKDKLDPGNWELTLSELNGLSFSNQNYTGSNVQVSGSGKVIKLVDDSLDSDERVSTGGITQPVYKIYSGSISNGIYSTGSQYGFMYPDLGIIILSGNKLNSELNFNSVSGSNVNGDNAFKLFTSISGSSAPTGSRTETHTFDARNVKLKTTAHYFLRVKNYEYNYSNNPTYVSGSEGEFKHSTFVRDPRTYVTSIGLYNDRYELLAVSKISKPIIKSFVNELNVTVKLEY